MMVALFQSSTAMTALGTLQFKVSKRESAA